MKQAFSLSILVATILLTACSTVPKSYVALLPNPDGSTGKIMVSGDKGRQQLATARTAAPLDGSQPAAPIDEHQLERDFGAALAAQPPLPERFLLYFESGGTKLTAESAALLPVIVTQATRRPGIDLSIIGHSDTVGRAETNAELSLKRAQVVAELLKEHGLASDRLSIESHGESNLLVQTPDETPEPRNRRVEVSIR